jgi:hypothetical protein
MDRLGDLISRKRELLIEIGRLGAFRRGSIVEQYLETRRKDGSVVRNGPYLLYSFKDKEQKTVARRIQRGEEEKFRGLLGGSSGGMITNHVAHPKHDRHQKSALIPTNFAVVFLPNSLSF